MKRVMIIGAPGTGKSTFAKKLAAKTGLPLVHLDFYYHDKSKNYYEDKEAWKARATELATGDSWIIDGNYSKTMADRMQRADTIIYFDMPRAAALQGVAKRRVQYHHKRRQDMPDDWQERAGWEFLTYVWGFRKKYRDATYELLAQQTGKQVVIFKTRKQADNYLRML